MITPPIFMMQIFDKVITSKSLETLLMLLIMMIWIFFIMWLLEFIRSRIMGRVCSKIEMKLSDRIYMSIFKHSAETGERANSQYMGDLQQIRTFLTGHTFFAMLDGPWIVFFLILLFMFNIWYGLFAIGMILIFIVIALLNDRFSKNHIEDSNRYSLESAYILNSQVQNPEVVQSMGLYGNLRKRWAIKINAYYRAQENLTDQFSVWENISKTLKLASMTLMSALGALLIVQGEITPGMLIAGGLLLGKTIMPIDALIHSWKPLDNFKSSIDRVDTLLADFPAEEKKTKMPLPQASLKVENLTLVAPKAEKHVIEDLSFSLVAGDVLGIVGPSASGKSSLARALTGLWEPKSGHVRLDGTDLCHWNMVDLGEHIGYLPQDTALFEGSVTENIARFGEQDDEEVVSAAKLAGVHDMIQYLPGGYDTQVGNLGYGLSGGQRQRIALARAFYKKPKLIVLDEPNANLDSKGELALMRAIVNMKVAGSITILITHRPRVLEVTDKVMVIKDGKLVTIAPYAELKGKVEI
jgi:ATP-binding cassette subfamily C protein EexD